MSHAPVQEHRRYQVEMDVDVRFARDHLVRLKTENVSLGGIFVCSTEFPPLGAELLLRLHTPTGVFTVDSRVIHRLEEVQAIEQGRPAGLGLLFVGLSSGAEEALKKMMQQQKVEAWKERAVRGLTLARQGFKSTVEKVRAQLVAQDVPEDTAVPWYQRSRAEQPPPAEEVKPPEPEEEPATAQMKDLLALAREHEQAGEFEEARHTWLCAHELIKKHPHLGALLDEAMFGGKG